MVADCFNNHFASVFIEGRDASVTSDYSHANTRQSLTVDFAPHLVFAELTKLPSKTGITPDGIPPTLLKRCAMGFADPISKIFDCSWKSSKIPDSWRHAIVSPIFKKGDRANVSNYRPISLTCVCSKIMESIIRRAMVKYLDSNGLLSDAQHGFRPRRSVATQLTKVVNDWALSLNRSVPVDAIYVDFKSAFDRVRHDILLRKMVDLGFGADVLLWCADFLLDRKFVVKIGDSFSDSAPCGSGVPQGSVLGPLLFLIFVNDVATIFSNEISCSLYADDLKLYCEVTPTLLSERSQGPLQSACDSLFKWSETFSLGLALDKCFVFHLGCKNVHHRYFLGDSSLQSKSIVRDLGITISDNLNFSAHCFNTAKRASNICNMILRFLSSKRPELYLQAYRSFVLPIMDYCSVVWSPYLAKDILVLQRVQDRFLRRVNFRCGLSRSSKMSLPSVISRRDIADQKFLRYIRGSHLFEKLFVTRETRTRSGSVLQPLAVARTNYINNLFAWRVSRASQLKPS